MGFRPGTAASAMFGGGFDDGFSPSAAGGGGGALAFRSVSTSTDLSNVTSHPMALPAGYQAGDVLVFVASGWKSPSGPPGAFTLPAGWTLQGIVESDGATNTYAVYTRVADGTEGTTITLTTVATCVLTGGILAYSGSVGGVGAFTDFGSLQSGTATPTTPSVTTTAASSTAVAVAISKGLNGTNGSAAAGWTKRLDFLSSSSATVEVFAMDKTVAAAGPSGTAVPTFAGASNWWTFAVEVKP